MKLANAKSLLGRIGGRNVIPIVLVTLALIGGILLLSARKSASADVVLASPNCFASEPTTVTPGVSCSQKGTCSLMDKPIQGVNMLARCNVSCPNEVVQNSASTKYVTTGIRHLRGAIYAFIRDVGGYDFVLQERWGEVYCSGWMPSSTVVANPCPEDTTIYGEIAVNGSAEYESSGGDGGGGDECIPQNCCGDSEAAECCSPTEDPCVCNCSPILIDIQGNGFQLTDAASGVSFDLNSDGHANPIAWTTANSDDAWLALDRNSNGTIDDGRELFGSTTLQPATPAPHGFLALAEYDKTEQGGNSDGRIDSRDAIYASLRLWQDSNRNGISEANELRALSALGVAAIELDYREARRRDQHGNEFRYRAKVYGTNGSQQLGRWAYDVFLVRAP